MSSKPDGTSPTPGPQQAASQQLQSPSVPAAADAAAAHKPDQAPKLGTGVFMPMVGATRSYSSVRSKPQRHRNASTSCLDTRPNGRGAPRRQNSSTAGLGLVQQHSSVFPAPGTSPAGETFLGPARAAAMGPVLAAPGGAGLSASATTVMLMEGSQPLSHAFAADQQQLPVYQQPVVSPFSMMANCRSSSGLTAVAGGSDCAAPLQQGPCLVSLGSAGMVPAASGHLSTLQHSGSFLHAAGTAAFHSQPAVLQLPVAHATAAQQPSALLHPIGRAAAAPVHTTLSMPCMDAVGHVSGALTADSSTALLSGPLLSRDSSVLGSDVMAQWTALGLSEQDLLNALLADPQQGCDLALQQDEISRTIQQLRLMKRLLRLKQQHKLQAQQRMLQAQQQQQQQLLQQQLLQRETGGRAQCDETQQLQQELLQLLNRRGGEAALPLGVPVTTAGAPPSLLQACPIALPEAGSAISVSSNTLTGGLQQLLGQGGLQTSDALMLSNLLQERVSLRQQVVVQTAPGNLFAQQPQ